MFTLIAATLRRVVHQLNYNVYMHLTVLLKIILYNVCVGPYIADGMKNKTKSPGHYFNLSHHSLLFIRKIRKHSQCFLKFRSFITVSYPSHNCKLTYTLNMTTHIQFRTGQLPHLSNLSDWKRFTCIHVVVVHTSRYHLLKNWSHLTVKLLQMTVVYCPPPDSLGRTKTIYCKSAPQRTKQSSPQILTMNSKANNLYHKRNSSILSQFIACCFSISCHKIFETNHKNGSRIIIVRMSGKLV